MLSRKKHKLFFRADGGPTVGMGHIMRCLALAEMLQEEYEIFFVTRSTEASIQGLIKAHDFNCIELSPGSKIIEELEVIAESSNFSSCLIVLDGYHFTAEYEKALVKAGHKVLSIDDLHQRPFFADVVLNHAGGVDAQSYKTSLHTRLCLGPQYALVREVFRQKRLQERQKGSLLLAMGGADPNNITQHLLNLLQAIKFQEPIVLILGAAFRHELKVSESFRVKVLRNATPAELAEQYRKAGVALLPSSTMAYEACATRVTLICGVIADNQQLLHRFLSSNQLALDAGAWEEMNAEKLKALIQQALQPSFQEEQLKAQEAFFDNQQKERILKIFKKLQKEKELQIRKAAPEDCELYFRWANDAETRKQAIHPEPIPWEKHVSWFNRKLAQEDSTLYLLEKEGKAVGQVRFDADPEERNTFIISYSMAPEVRGQGLGEAVLQNALRVFQQERKGEVILHALVKERNLASVRIFENLSFTSVGKTELKKEVYWKFRKKAYERI
ncbi:UDP-2,4-diacetamido-2,4,6-trideoxy-beta-L-altropyranose hydrolase [Nafulsella turpanensis]|uniref:UDP-2,4-diacetamido-2,4, 6-trideoxy-beta-L-altropyranose hydrolase n=1 Tax=Nafulsella turpanensis TaxID=1265690 RepID=UPI00037560C2|nr:UDP-2,4-diacetamido-2,4,6-trideoxy-beta-L-altropyranose hydrolase [Nafulsella turpanensis]